MYLLVIVLIENYFLIMSGVRLYVRELDLMYCSEVFKNRCSEKYCKFFRKRPVVESLVAKKLQRPASLLKRHSNRGGFFCEYCRLFIKNTYFEEHLRTTAFDYCECLSFWSEHQAQKANINQWIASEEKESGTVSRKR